MLYISIQPICFKRRNKKSTKKKLRIGEIFSKATESKCLKIFSQSRFEELKIEFKNKLRLQSNKNFRRIIKPSGFKFWRFTAFFLRVEFCKCLYCCKIDVQLVCSTFFLAKFFMLIFLIYKIYFPWHNDYLTRGL